MKKTLLILSALTLVSLNMLTAQVETTFAGSANEEFARNIVRTTDGGYIMAGWADEPGSTTFRDLFMLKCDVNGVQQWVKYYGKTGKREMLYRGLVTVGTTGYLIAGNRNSPNDRGAFLVRTNTSGDTIWTKTIAIPNSILVIINDARELSDGFLVTGSTVETGGTVDDKKMILFKTDLNGNLLWLRTYSAGQGNALYVTSGGSYVVVGQEKIWRIRNNGDLAWERTVTFSVPGYPGTPRVVLRDIAESNTALIFSGFYTLDVSVNNTPDTLSGLLALRYTTGGSQTWLKRYENGLKITDNHYAEGATLLFTNSQQYYLTGTVNGRIKALRINANGLLVSTTNIGTMEVNAPTMIKQGTYFAIVAQSNDEPTDTYFYRTSGNALNYVQSDNPPVQETGDLGAERGASEALVRVEQLFPNPASDRIALDIYSEEASSQPWAVFNQQGKMVLNGVWEQAPGTTRQNLDVSQLSAGLYALQFGTQSVQFVKE